MRATILICTLVAMAACAEQPAYQDPAPTNAGAGQAYAPPTPCKRSDYAEGAAGDTEYTNCIIQN